MPLTEGQERAATSQQREAAEVELVSTEPRARLFVLPLRPSPLASTRHPLWQDIPPERVQSHIPLRELLPDIGLSEG